MLNIKRIITKFIINNFLSCTHFWSIKRGLLRFAGIVIGDDSKIVGPIYFGNAIEINIGKSCWIGKNFNLDGNGRVILGNNIDIAPHVVITTGGHRIGNMDRRAGNGIVNSIKIGDGCWIGTRSTILNSICIGEGCVIAAGSVVIRNSKANQLLAGVPAISKRNL